VLSGRGFLLDRIQISLLCIGEVYLLPKAILE